MLPSVNYAPLLDYNDDSSIKDKYKDVDNEIAKIMSIIFNMSTKMEPVDLNKVIDLVS